MTENRQNKFGDYSPNEHDITNKAQHTTTNNASIKNKPTEESGKKANPGNENSLKPKSKWPPVKLLMVIMGISALATVIFFSTQTETGLQTDTKPPVKLIPLDPPSESPPPKNKVGVLDRSQIMFCLAESKRLDTAIDAQSQSKNYELSSRVNRYNERCLDGKYYTQDMDWAKEQFKLFEDTYIQQGIEITKNSTKGSPKETFVSIFLTEGRNGGGFGQGSTIEAAKKAANQSCIKKYPNSKCVERLSGTGRCLSVANNSSGENVSAGIGETKEIASENALRSCRATHQGCNVPDHQSKCDIN